ncbi:hypothetical protein VMCG_01874 [Cytospora schulzeri]|uniref:Uncharacterized protein n=1 Tax=Cytospora schulzeri TaxID=448051 RepID=A0A423X2W8_9PEZI|nr:hypothetical protein VMCG_01874 [Valsa malicola]
MPRKATSPSLPSAAEVQDASDQPQSRTLIFVLRFIELLLTGSTCGLLFWGFLTDLAVPSVGGASSGHAAIFLFCAALIGMTSATLGLIALCFKFNLLEALEPGSLKIGRFHYCPIYFGVLYLIIGSIGSWASIIYIPFEIYAIEQAQGKSQCSANLSAYKGCSVLVAAISLNCCGLAATLVTYGASKGGA